MGSAGAVGTRRRGSIYDARIAGLYDLEETIGRGHFAVVKLAKHVFTGEKVAVKVIDKTKLDPVSKAHLFQEVRCMKLVQHPNIVRLYEVIDTATKLFLILELGDYDMYDYIMRQGGDRCVGVSEQEAQRYFSQIIRAISYCHKLHVVHRDLKPENVVFFEKLGMVKLTDFGFSNLFTPGQQLDTSCGSLAYSAPEILLGDAYEPPAVDVWSLGVILYMLVCGCLPFQEANDSETLTKILDCSFSLPSSLTEECQNLIRRMLVRDPTKRATLAELSESPWICAGDLGHAELLPLVSRNHITEETHQQIVEQMVNGGVAEAEEILHALNRDDYTSVTATYYLLAEQILRKERHKQAQQLLSAMTRSDSQLQLASLALSPRAEENSRKDLFENSGCTCAIDSTAACVQVKSGHATGLSPTSSIQCLVSPIGRSAFAFESQQEQQSQSQTDTSLLSPTSSGQPHRERATHRIRACSIVREESEDETSSVHIRSSRSASPSHGSSPKISPVTSCLSLATTFSRWTPPPSSLDLHESTNRPTATVSGAPSNGRATPDRSGSRSPSPREGRISPVTSKLKPTPITGSTSRKLQTISSSPQLLGICEEGEDDEANGRQTYSQTRMIKPRHAVVSPDVIRRYDKPLVSVSRTRRSTSCSSSETSDDEERRLCLISSHCRKNDANDNDDDQEPPTGAGGNNDRLRRRNQQLSLNGSAKSTSAATSIGVSGSDHSGSGTTTTVSGGRKTLDARKLASKLRKLALAPIREVPNIVFSRFGAGRLSLMDEARDWFRPLNKPKSCEHLPFKPPAEKQRNNENCLSSDRCAVPNEEAKVCGSPSAGVRRKHKVKRKRKCFDKLKMQQTSFCDSVQETVGFARTLIDKDTLRRVL